VFLVPALLLAGGCWGGAAPAESSTGFGAMLREPQQSLPFEQAVRLAREGNWQWLRVGTAPLESTRTGIALVFWPAARTEPAEFSSELSTSRLATDPWAVFRDARSRLLAKDSPHAYEIGNEPDLYFTPDLPDRMALTLKAAWWAIKTVQPEAAVLMPSLDAWPGPYAAQLAANGIGPFTDGWNIHLYGWAADFPGAVAEHRRFLARHGWQRLPVWVTETGFAEFPELPLPTPTVLLERQRAFFERVTLAAPFSRIAQQWAFVLGPYHEQGKDYGLNDPDWAPRPALDALVKLTSSLREWRPAFTLRERAHGETVGLVLAREDVWWTVLFTPNRRADFDLPEIEGVTNSTGLVRAPATSYFAFKLEFPDGYGPVQLGLDAAGDPVQTNHLSFTASAATNLFLRTPARKFAIGGVDWIPVSPPRGTPSLHQAPISPQLVLPPIPPPSPVVISITFPSSSLTTDRESIAYRYRANSPLDVALRLDNFGANNLRGRWQVTVPPGWTPWHATALSGEAIVAAGETSWCKLRLVPAPGVASSARESLVARWSGADRRRDVASVVLAPARTQDEPFNTTQLPNDWRPTESDTQWERTELADGAVRLKLVALRPGVTTGLLLPLPAGVSLQPDDLLRLRVRAADAGSEFRRRLELITPGRQVFRHGDDWPVGQEGQTIEMRVGDFTPAFWSRADPTGRTTSVDARYFRLGLFGLQAGATLEIGPFELLRPVSQSGLRK
jgi:hypothetical protein